MEKINFDQFADKFKVRRNPIKAFSNYGNTMLDVDEEELEELDEVSPTKTWSLLETPEDGLVLQPGRINKFNTIGFFICKNEWKSEKQTFILV